MSVPMILSDLEREDVRGQIFFPADLYNYARTIWPRTTKFSHGNSGRGGAYF